MPTQPLLIQLFLVTNPSNPYLINPFNPLLPVAVRSVLALTN